jgi:hypothetical protein
MDRHPVRTEAQRYNRDLLLHGAKRNAVLDLDEVRRYGLDSYGDADYVSIYGMTPPEWYAKGVRLLGRTAVECTRDQLGDLIGRDVASIAAMEGSASDALVLDPFAGSGNTLFWLLRHLPRAKGLGFENDAGVFQLTHTNFAAIGLRVDYRNADFRFDLSAVPAAGHQLLIAFIAPPWGDALDEVTGLDLRRTSPPIVEIIDILCSAFASRRLLFAIQVHETVDAASLTDVEARLDWSVVRIHVLDAPGSNHGILLGGKRWVPRAA